MKNLIHKLVTFLIFLSFGSVLFVSLDRAGHHLITDRDTHCPFMSHEDTICPMSSFEHISTIRSLLESTKPSVIELFVIGSTLVLYINVIRPDYSLYQKTKVFMRWRKLILYNFFQKAYQALLSNGILNPKLFS